MRHPVPRRSAPDTPRLTDLFQDFFLRRARTGRRVSAYSRSWCSPTGRHDMDKSSRDRRLVVVAFAAAAAAAAALVVASASAASAATTATTATQSVQAPGSAAANAGGHRPVQIEVFAPERHDNAGIQGKGWFVDMEIDFPGGPHGLDRAGFSGLQLTGPAGYNNVAPFPGLFSTAHDDRNPGLAVLTSTTHSTT